jgi:hypothetical protein
MRHGANEDFAAGSCGKNGKLTDQAQRTLKSQRINAGTMTASIDFLEIPAFFAAQK